MKAVTKNISLTPELDQFIDDRVNSGLYESASEVVREGLRLLRHREDLQQEQVARVRAKIEKGAQDLERGDIVTDAEAREHFRQRGSKRRPRRAWADSISLEKRSKTSTHFGSTSQKTA
jgi:antitoxin ParD1/3/4